ncbi:MAG TPA: conjugal transfer protein MobC [Puia sp.]|nr:conjugal transfer protein MobC [Puia sp.]
MTRSTGENETSLNDILRYIRMSSIALLLLHFYYYLYGAFRDLGWTTLIGDRLLAILDRAGLFSDFLLTKMVALGLLAISLLGTRGRKKPEYTPQRGILVTAAGLLFYFGSAAILYLDFPTEHVAFLYVLLCFIGYLLILRGGGHFSRVIWRRMGPDIFNRIHESFPQEERRIENAYSVNLPAIYQNRGEARESWVNIIDPYRGTLVLGSPGSGKTWYIIQNIIKQQISKGYAMLLYDFKYDDLSKLAYNYFLQYHPVYPGNPAFYNISFDDLSRSHRCNCLAPATMTDITDAGEAARTIMLGLNMEWVGKQGDFFIESSINFVKALIWFLCQHRGGMYCSWPHVIELAQTPYKQLFSVLRVDPQIQAQINPFVNAFLHGAMEQLEGQIASATISLAKLTSPAIYYILTGDDFTLDLNNPKAPKILTIGSNPQKTGTYGPIISAYINTINRLANRKGMHPLSEVFDEFSTIIVHTIDKSIATGRSNKMAITLCLQDGSQLRLAYGKEFADVILHTCGNIISGQVSGETARQLSDRFGKTMQDRESITYTSSDTNITQSQQLEYSIPVSRIATLSSGEFVGMVADSPDQAMELKIFCCRVVNDPAALQEEEAAYKELPLVREVTHDILLQNFQQIRDDITGLIRAELQRIENTPELRHLLIE